MKGKRSYDLNLLCVTLFLVALGLIMVTSASQIVGQERFRSPFFFMQRHAIRVAFGVCVLLFFMKIPYRIYQRFSLPILLVSFFLLAAIFFWGFEVRGANRWLPLFNFMLQPVEIAKLSLVMFLAGKIADLKKHVYEFKKGFLPLAIVSSIMAVLVALQPNFTNAALILILSFAILFVGGCRLHHLAAFGACMVSVAVSVVLKVPSAYGRISAFINGGQDTHGANWQIDQSLIALGSGFIFGCGPGKGHQKYSFLPDAHTDFIYSIIGEELGAIGTILVLIIFAFILRQAVRTAKRSSNSFGYLLALGIGISIFASATINIAMTLGILPIAGLPLPFISYGGTSLITSMASIGILLNISSAGCDRVRMRETSSERKSTRRVYARRVKGRGKPSRY